MIDVVPEVFKLSSFLKIIFSLFLFAVLRGGAFGRGSDLVGELIVQGLRKSQSRETASARVTESSDLASACAVLAGWRGTSTEEQWHLPALLSLERGDLTAVPLCLALKLLKLVPPYALGAL